MLFAHDTEEALGAAVALVNSAPTDDQADRLPDVAALEELLDTWNWTGRRDRSHAELRAVRELRPRLRRFWEVGEDDAVALVNELLAESNALPQLVKHDNWDYYHLHATSPDAPLVERMSVEAAMAMADVIRSGELGRLLVCSYPGCRHVIVDLSKNRSKRYCDEGCGNRAAVAAYRARKAKKP